MHPSSRGSELHQGQTLQHCHNFFYPLGDLQMNPVDSQIRFSFPTFFERKCPRCVSKTCLCRRPRARVQALCRRQSTSLCEHTRTRIVYGPSLTLGHLCMCSMYTHTCNLKSFCKYAKHGLQESTPRDLGRITRACNCTVRCNCTITTL